MLKPSEFKRWVDSCVQSARDQGLSDEEIYLEFLEQLRFMTCNVMMKVANKR